MPLFFSTFVFAIFIPSKEAESKNISQPGNRSAIKIKKS